MRRFIFSDEVLRSLAQERYHHPDPRVQQRMEILWLKSQGETHERIAALAGVSRPTVQRVLDVYDQGGLDGIRLFHWKGHPSALTPHRESLEKEFTERPPHTVGEACQRIEELTGVRRKPEAVRKFLREHLGLRFRKVAAVPVPPKQSVEEHAKNQAAFLNQELEPRLAEARAGKRTVMFVDAAHFVLGSFLGCLWCVARLFVRAASGRQRYNVLAALDAVTHRLVRLTNHTYINSESVCTLLRQIAALGLPGPITLVLDNARYQRCHLVQNLARELNIELLFLLPYSPNLNLIERLWKFVKKEVLNSRHHQNYQLFQSAIDRCLDEMPTAHKMKLETLLTHEFQTFEDVSVLNG